MIKNISNLGDAAVYCDFGSDINKTINSYVIDYFDHLSELIKKKKIDGITNLTPSYNKLIVSFDLNLTNYKKTKNIIENLNIKKNKKKDNINIEIPVCCEEEYGLDFKRLNDKLEIGKDEIIKLFFSKEYFCYMTGFIAGIKM